MPERFSREIASLTATLQQMAVATEEAVLNALRAVAEHDVALARQVIDGDSQIDASEVKIEEECLKLLALYQPVATDLRTVITILKVNNEIERAADLAVNIADRVDDMARFDEDQIEKFDFGDMREAARLMLQRSIDALVYHDAQAAQAVINADDHVDELHRANYGRVTEMIIRHPAEGAYYMDCLTVSRALERLADIATNISENVIYLEQGKIVRHIHDS